MTRTEQQIEQVAGIIYEAEMTPEEARRQNAGDGWTFDVRYDDGEYVNETNWTRVEGLQLSDANLQKAIAIAKRFGQ